MIPVLLLADVNSACDNIKVTVVQSREHDFEVIGGRQAWLDYLNSFPVQWYILGFAITKSWLTGFVGGVVTTLGALYAEKFLG
jgi:hypothetical protein